MNSKLLRIIWMTFEKLKSYFFRAEINIVMAFTKIIFSCVKRKINYEIKHLNGL